jgi:hypothetical protein
MAKYLPIILTPLLPLTAKVLFYVAAFRIRKIEITLLTCVLVAGASFLLMAVPIPLPVFISFLLSLILPCAVARHYTEAPLYPDLIAIVGVVEILSIFATDYVWVPLIHSLG